VGRAPEAGGLPLTPMTDGAPEPLGPVGLEPGGTVRAEWRRRLGKVGIVRAQVARRAAVDAVDVREPDLADPVRPRGEAQGVGSFT
jgi:hypothetical protein